ncbi:MAG: hypothetical protein ACK5V3_08930, partial [Bdellovibrionales bacterium]
MKIIFFLISIFNYSVFAKPEVVLKSYLNTNNSLPLLFEDIVDSPKGVPAELIDIGFMEVG